MELELELETIIRINSLSLPVIGDLDSELQCSFYKWATSVSVHAHVHAQLSQVHCGAWEYIFLIPWVILLHTDSSRVTSSIRFELLPNFLRYWSSCNNVYLRGLNIRIGLDWIGLNWIELDWIGLNWIELDWIGLNWIELDWIELDWIGLNWIELNWIELDWIELNWIELNWIELNWIELNWVNPSLKINLNW